MEFVARDNPNVGDYVRGWSRRREDRQSKAIERCGYCKVRPAASSNSASFTLVKTSMAICFAMQEGVERFTHAPRRQDSRA
mmetsp:Transcript_25569/g.57635  ORF Transcript_25569/g.57635 Transcript_25569/m.57635 type:complete len:81 (+) Transcript_25569:552-794(+)